MNRDPRVSHRRGAARTATWSSLGTKVILLVLVSTLVTALLVSWISIHSTTTALRVTIDRVYPSALDHASQRIDPWIQQVRLELEHNAHRSDDGDPLDVGEIDAPLEGLALVDAEGAILQRSGRFPDGAQRALLHPERLAQVAFADGSPALAIAPLWGTPGAQLVGVIPLAFLAPILEVELPGPDAFLALVDAEGRVLVGAGSPPVLRVAERVPLGELRGGRAVSETSVAGVPLIGSAHPIGQLGWHIALVSRFDAAYAPVLSMVSRLLVIDLCIIVVFSLLAYRFTARLVHPIAQLLETAQIVSRGETDVEVPRLHTRDEIGLLARAFDLMLRRLHRHREEIEETNRSLTDRNARLEQANEVLSQLSITDGLTKLHNHRFFQDHLTREIRRVERTREDLAILLIDLDDFKRLNDRLGHASGDEILVRIARILNDTVRASDLCARYGGEEFVVLAPNTDVGGAYQLAEKIRTAAAEASFIVDDSMRPLRVTLSIGVATFDGNRKRFFQRADQALYQAKANGKNCVVVHDEHTSATDGATQPGS